MTTPINPEWQTRIDLNLDLEVTNLNVKHFYGSMYKNGKLNYNPNIALAATQFMEATQVGFKKHGEDYVHHIFVNDVYSHHVPPHSSYGLKTETKLLGKQTDAALYQSTSHTKHDIQEYLSSQPNLNKRKVKFYMKNIAPAMEANSTKNAYLMKVQKNKDLFVSTFSHKLFLEKSREELNEMIKDFPYVRSSETTMDAFYGKGARESLYNIMDDFLKDVSAVKPKTFGGWNAPFEVYFIRGVLERTGHVDLAQRFDAAMLSGAIKVESAEREWQLIAWKLLEENPGMIENFKINYNPVAYAETGGRSGYTPKTFQELQHSITWKENTVAKYFSWHESIQEALAGAAGEVHFAGPDVQLTDALVSLMNKIKGETFTIASSRGLNFSSFEEFALSKTSQHGRILEEAIMAVSANRKLKHVGTTSGADILNVMKSMMVGDAKSAANFSAKRFPSFMAEKVSINNVARMKKYGGLVVAAMALLGGTYLGKGDEDYDLSGSNSFKKGYSGAVGLSQYTDSAAKYPNHPNQIFSKVLPAAGLSFAALYGTGLATVLNKGHVFGSQNLKNRSIFDIARGAIRTAYIGAKQIESKVPLARIFRITAMHDYLYGSKKYRMFKNSKGEDAAIAMNVDIIDDFQQKTWAKKHNLSELLEDMHKTNPREAAEIEGYINPVNRNSAIEKRTLRITRDGRGNAVVWFEDVERTGDIASRKKVIGKKYNLDLNIQMFKMKQQGYGGKLIENTIGYNKAAHNLSRGTAKIAFDDYLSTVKLPKSAQNSETWKKVWTAHEWFKWKFEFMPKGVGQGLNELRPSVGRSLHSIEDYVTVRYHSRDRFSVNSIKRAVDYAKHIGEEYTIHAMNRFLETPLESSFIKPETLRRISGRLSESANPIANILGKATSFLDRAHLGLDIASMRFGGPEYIARMTLMRGLPLGAGILGLNALDHMMGAIMGSKDGRGPLTKTPIKAFELARLGYAKVSDLSGLTSMSKEQSRFAPGSTGIGFFALPATMYGAWWLGSLAYKHGPDAIRNGVDNVGRKLLESSPALRRAIRPELFPGALAKNPAERLLSWAVKNPKMAFFAAGVLPMLPFAPGFIGSDKSYNELKAEYKGERDVAIRKYRGWLFSSSPFEGGKPIQFRRHAFNLFEKDWENRVIWPSFFKRFAHTVTGGLFGRYMLEEYHKEDQPVYSSAPFGASVPLIGPLIAATIGKIVKPRVDYHDTSEGIGGAQGTGTSSAMGGILPSFGSNYAPMTPGIDVPLSRQDTINVFARDFMSSFEEFAGFKGFTARTIRQFLTGETTGDEFRPYAQSAKQFYNTANEMWAYNFGDVTAVGGEFLRRIYQSPEKKWEVNNIPNELYGVNWLPHNQNYGKDMWHGTTFDKSYMGWLYASRKGWEELFPEVEGANPEDYSDPVRLEILKQVAPGGSEFNVTAERLKQAATRNELNPKTEQRFYETLDQVRQLRTQIYAHASNYAFRLDTDEVTGRVSQYNPQTGTFRLDETGDQEFRLAGISTNINDIRARLLQRQKFDSSTELDEAANEIQTRMFDMIQDHLSVGEKITIDTPANGSFSGNNKPLEAMLGSLNEDLIGIGAPFADTGNLATHNLAQDQLGMSSRAMAKYWDFLTAPNTFWNKKLISDRDYFRNYLANQVYNKEVKLWSRPIEHLLEPMIATTLQHFGINITPSFTKERRDKQQYWDIIKYMKYKMLAIQSSREGDRAEAAHYHNLWRKTMLGADPTDGNPIDERDALPLNERAYFDFFANEPDPSKRAKIYENIPKPARRIYNAIWMKQQAETTRDPETIEAWERLRESEGYSLSEEDEQNYQAETNGEISKADWARAKIISNYSETHALPGADWIGWQKDIDIDNIELLALKDQGEQIQDYGYFESKARMAAYDQGAYDAAVDLNSIGSSDHDSMGMMLPMLAQYDGLSGSVGMLTMSQTPLLSADIMTNAYDKLVKHQNDHPLFSDLDEDFR